MGGTRLRMRDVLQADRALADLVELAAPAASASRFPSSSLRFPLPRQQPPLPASPPAASASPPRATATRELSLQFPKKKKKRQRTHQHALDARAVDAGRAQVGEHDVVLGAAGDEGVAPLGQAGGEGLGVLQDLSLVGLEVAPLRLVERAREPRDRVVVRAALEAGEDGEVDLVLYVVLDGLPLLVRAAHALAEEDHRAARPAQRLVRRRGDHVGVLKGGRDEARRDQPRNVGHVSEEPRAVAVGDRAHARVVVVPRIGRRARHDELGAEEGGRVFQFVVVDDAGRFVEAVGQGLEIDRRRGNALRVGLVPVRQVAAVGEIQAHDAVVRVEEGGVDLRRREGEEGWSARSERWPARAPCASRHARKTSPLSPPTPGSWPATPRATARSPPTFPGRAQTP